MNFDNLINGLKEKGIEAEGITVCKNGCECLGIRVLDPDCPNASPVIYYSPEETMESILERISNALESNIKDFDPDCLEDPAFVTRNVYFSIQKVAETEKENDILKRDCLNLELVLRIMLSLGDSTGSIKVSRHMLDVLDVDEDILWDVAMENMRHRFTVRSIAEMLGLPEGFPGEPPFYVCTTDSGTNGASALAFPAIFRRFCEDKGLEKVYILPSSTEEVLICPVDTVDDTSLLADMVRDVNAACVDPQIQLEPAAYCYDYSMDELTIAATSEGGR